MLKTANKKFFIAIFAREPSFTIGVAEKEKNTNDASGVVSEAEDDALGERPQNEITLLLVLCPELRLMRPWGALKCLI